MNSFPRAGEDKPSPRRYAVVNWGPALSATSAGAKGHQPRWWALLGLHSVFVVISFVLLIDSQCLKTGRFHVTGPYSLLLLNHWENW